VACQIFRSGFHSSVTDLSEGVENQGVSQVIEITYSLRGNFDILAITLTTLSFRRALHCNDPRGRFTLTRCKVGRSDSLDLILSWGDGGIASMLSVRVTPRIPSYWDGSDNDWITESTVRRPNTNCGLRSDRCDTLTSTTMSPIA
jgi:hypothetical protein